MIFYIILALLILLSPAAQAHVPILSLDNTNLTSATNIYDSAKSWAVYSELPHASVRYLSFDAEKGQKIILSLLAPTDPKLKGFQPYMALMGPGISTSRQMPGYIQVPSGYNTVVVKGVRPNTATYEPFGPSSYYKLAELNLTSPAAGRYFIAVYDPKIDGRYCLALGYKEEPSLAERVMTPIRLISIYQWEGQSLTLILMPIVISALVGIGIIWFSPRPSAFGQIGTLAGLLFIGTSSTILDQAIFNLTKAPYGSDVNISLGLAVTSAILGVSAIRLSRSGVALYKRIAMIILGIIALLIGSGLIAGPTMAIIAGVMPGPRSETDDA